MNLNEFYEEVSRNADTDKIKVTGADVKRVMSEAFKVLANLDAASATEVLSKGLTLAKKKLDNA